MPSEIIGEFGTSGASSEWIEAEGKLAIFGLKIPGRIQVYWKK